MTPGGNSTVTTIPVGTNPDGAAYDSGMGEVFVASYNSDNVSVLSDLNNSVVATVNLETPVNITAYPSGMMYDNRTGEVFLANTPMDNIKAISDANNTVVATLGVGGSPKAVA